MKFLTQIRFLINLKALSVIPLFPGMLHRPLLSKRRLSVIISLFACAAFSTLIFFHEEPLPAETNWVNPPLKQKTPGIRSKARNVLLPAGIHFPRYALREHLSDTESEEWQILQLKKTSVMEYPPHEPGRFKSTEPFLFSRFEDSKCALEESKIVFAADTPAKVPVNLNTTFQIFNEEAEQYDDSYNQFLRPHIEKYLSPDALENSWHRFSGTSVWLKDYSVHLVVSQLVFAEDGDRNKPKFSLPLAQIFDEKWDEVEDVRVVFPSNNVTGTPGFEVNNKTYISHRFPRILPIPFAIEEDGKNWGTEDLQMTLFQNDFGRDEPVLVFSSFHLNGEIEQDHSTGIRSVFMSYPFQVQVGKNIGRFEDESANKHVFTRTKQLKLEGEPEKPVEKNWVPFYNTYGDNQTHVMFATRLEPLKIIKCELWTENGECVVEHPGNEKKLSPLRGGTPFVSVKRIEADDREYFIGFAAAHLQDCGCGRRFYRPNIVVVERRGKKWSIVQVSTSVDIGAKISFWKPEGKVCEGVNAVLPRGIEFWDFDRDILSLDLSVNDIAVEKVHLSGVLKALEDTKYWEVKDYEKGESPVSCALDYSRDFCKAFGLENQGISSSFLKSIVPKGKEWVNGAVF
ncbi:hypothetical protein OXX69_009097 [Metschnikowia pulcherrima]